MNASLLLLGAGFLSGWMLLWALAASIPVAIHLLTRRRQANIPWAAMQLLLEVIERESKRVRLEQLLLLIVRTAILLLLALALARPFLDAFLPTSEAVSNRPPRHWVLAIDASYSMGYRDAGKSLFQNGIEQAVQLVDAANEGDAFSIVQISEPSAVITGRPTFDQTRCVAELRRLRVLDTGGDLSTCVELVKGLLLDAAQQAAIPSDAHVVFLSDLGVDTWGAASDGSEAELRELSRVATVRVVSVAPESISNVALTSLRVDSKRAVAGQSLTISAEIENFGKRSVQGVPIQFEMDGQSIASEYADVGAGESVTVTWSFTPPSPGLLALAASLPDDNLQSDNRRDFVLEIRDKSRVLIVDDKPGGSRLLRLALAPDPSQAKEIVRVVSPLELATTELREWDAVVVNDAANITPALLESLYAFVADGGSLVCCFGPATVASRWNGDADVDGLLGFELLEPSEESDWTVDPLEYASPVVAPFSGFPDAGLLTTPIFRYWKVAIDEQSFVTQDLACSNGEPLILSRRVGKGTVASILSAPSSGMSLAGNLEEPWNAMAAWPSFVPLMQRLLQVVLDSQRERYNLTVGSPLSGTVPATSSSREVLIRRPDASQLRLLAEPDSETGSAQWSFFQTRLRGLYSADQESGNLSRFALNIVPQESSMQSIDPASLAIDRAEELQIEPASGANLSAAPGRSNDWLPRGLLVALLGLLIAESLLAWKFGRRIG